MAMGDQSGSRDGSPEIDLTSLSMPMPQLIAELAADMRSLRHATGERLSREAVQYRPELLRRLAYILASRVGAEVTSLVGVAEDLALVVATSLHTGIPYAICPGGPDATSGHRGALASGDVAQAIAFDGIARDHVTAYLTRSGIRVQAAVAVLGSTTDEPPTTIYVGEELAARP